MTNTKNLASLAAALDDGTSGQVLQSTGSGGVQFADSTGSGVTTHTNQTAMVDADTSSAYTEGSLHFDLNANVLYVKIGSGAGDGFYAVATVENAAPSITSYSENTGGAGANDLTNATPPNTFTLTAGSNTVITINATEPNLETISYSATVTSGTATDVFSSPSFPVTNQSSNVFTLTPVTSGTGGTVTIRFDASDGTNVAHVSHSFEIAFVIADSHYTTLLMATDGSAGDNDAITYDTGSTTGNSFTSIDTDHSAGTFSPYRHGGYSAYFDGSSTLTLSNSSEDLVPEAGDFTYETWFYTSGTSRQDIYSSYTSSTGFGVSLSYSNAGDVMLYSGNTILLTTSAGDWDTNKWVHLAVSRSGTGSNNLKIFINGAQVGATTTTADFSGTSTMYIGAVGNDTIRFTGYLSDTRFVKGTAVYTGTFTPPTGRLTTTGGEYSSTTNVNTSITAGHTKLLTCHLPYIADGSSSAHSITVNGNTSTKPIGPYDYGEYDESLNGGSILIDAYNKLITLDDSSSDFALGTTETTIKLWYYPMDADATSVQWLIRKGTSATTAGHWALGHYSSNRLRFLIRDNGGSFFSPYSSNNVITPNTWNYIEWYQPTSGTGSIKVNGTEVISTATSSNYGSTTDTIRLPQTGQNPTNGLYYADFQFVKGDARESSVPTAPMSTNTNAKLHIKGTDAHVLDKSQSANLKLAGTAASTSALTSGSTPPYIGAAWANTSAVSFDGNSDYVIMPQIPLGSGNFTIEAYTYLDARLTSYPVIFSNYSSFSAGALGLFAGHGSSTTTNYQVAHNGAGFPAINGGPITYDQWVHLCLERYNGTITLYKDGASVNSFASTATLNGVGSNFYIGTTGDSIGTSYINGWIQDFRVTVGKARYQGAFTKPAAPLKG
jgi:hypothetical protein